MSTDTAPADSTQASSSTQAIALPAAEVTLLEDRARVVRRGPVEVPAGTTRMRIAGVAPVLVDKSLTARVLDPAQTNAEADPASADDIGVSVVDTQALRRRLIKPEDQPDGARALADDQLELERERAALTDRRAVLLAEREAIDVLMRRTLGEIAEDVSWGKGDSDGWSAQLDALREREQSLLESLREIGFAERDLRERMERLGARRSAQESPDQREAAEVELTVVATAARTVVIELSYVVPGACWRPYHTAKLSESDGQAQVAVRCDGCVWQNTGEDWREVELRFSTQRASLGTAPPLLSEDRLGIRRKRSEVVVETREQAITTTGLGAERAEAKVELPGIDDGGDTITLRARDRATIPSDGAPYRVMLFEFESEAETELLIAGELAQAAILRSVQTNRGTTPLLAGPIDLIRNAGYAGRTSVMYIAPGEKFELGWGPDPALRVHRRDERLEDESRMLSAWTTQRHKISVRISNIGAAPRTVHVKERIPVSEIDKVKITVDTQDSTGTAKPDSDGFIDWTINLPPFEQDTVTLRYDVKKHDDVQGL